LIIGCQGGDISEHIYVKESLVNAAMSRVEEKLESTIDDPSSSHPLLRSQAYDDFNCDICQGRNSLTQNTIQSRKALYYTFIITAVALISFFLGWQLSNFFQDKAWDYARLPADYAFGRSKNSVTPVAFKCS
jgi:hypothetical protein